MTDHKNEANQPSGQPAPFTKKVNDLSPEQKEINRLKKELRTLQQHYGELETMAKAVEDLSLKRLEEKAYWLEKYLASQVVCKNLFNGTYRTVQEVMLQLSTN